jgi:hypothetical protein
MYLQEIKKIVTQSGSKTKRDLILSGWIFSKVFESNIFVMIE